MNEPDRGEVTELLQQWGDGDREALENLLPIVYRELRSMASRHLCKERSDHTMQATDLVHEVYIRLIDQAKARFQNRAHFFAIAAQAMRRILVDHARRNQAAKRISAGQKVPLEWAPEISQAADPTILEVDELLVRLSEVDERQGRVVELRFFGGLTVAETASALGVSEATIAREWRMAKAWLRREIDRHPASDD